MDTSKVIRHIYSIEKASLSGEKLDRLLDFDLLREKSHARIKSGVDTARHRFRGLFTFPHFVRFFSFDGSIQVFQNPTETPFRHFFEKRDRVYDRGSSYLLRGARYLISINPTYEVRQKLKILGQDLRDAAEIAMDSGATIDYEHFFEQSAVLDYMKNSAITLLNAFIQREKLGRFNLAGRRYLRFRDSMIDISIHATRAYYGHLLGLNNIKFHIDYVREHFETIDEVSDLIEQQYVDGIFSSRYFSRPEAGHPLTILASTHAGASSVASRIDTVVGLPSGGTELAIVQQYAFELLAESKPKLLLIPISLHTIKNEFDHAYIDELGFARFLSRNSEFLKNRAVLVAEDNSSTGRTIQKTVELLDRYATPSEIFVSVAEADLVRSRLDARSDARTHIASPRAYDMSVAILPVSKVISPKFDMRGLSEKRRLASDYERKIALATSKSEEIMYKAFLRVIQQPHETVRESLNSKNSIRSFKNTYLSNFYITSIHYRGTRYPSVEHAYQSQKFDRRTLANLRDKDLTSIKEVMRERGRELRIKSITRLFVDRSLSSGNIKVIADTLRKLGYVRPDWDKVKIPLMISLLQQKFSNPDLKVRLQQTKGKYLVEGNDWNDTLWGVCNDRGRNLLGHVLMILRDEYLIL